MAETQTILFLTQRMIVGGAERYILEKSKWLIRKGYNVIIVSVGGIWEEKIKELGGKHYKLDFINEDPFIMDKGIFVERCIILKQIIEVEKVNIIEANQFYPAIWGYYVSKFTNTPYFMNVLAGTIFYKGKKEYLKFLKHLDNLGLYYNSECSNIVIEEIRRINLKNCIEIPIPVNKLDNGFENSINENYILTVCRMSPEKMYVKYLIKDFYKIVINNNLNSLKLIVVGEGPNFNEIQQKVKRLNKKLTKYSSTIELRGTVVGKELDVLFSGCLFYVGSGTTVIQAAQHKKSVILTSPIKSHMKYSIGFFSEDKNNSIGFKVGDMKLDSFYNRMKLLIFDEYRRNNLEENSYKRYKEVFETEIVMKQWMMEYKNISNRFTTYEQKIFREDRLFYFLKKIKSIIWR